MTNFFGLGVLGAMLIIAMYPVVMLFGVEIICKKWFKISGPGCIVVCWLLGIVIFIILHKSGAYPVYVFKEGKKVWDLPPILGFIIMTAAINTGYKMNLRGLKEWVRRVLKVEV